MQLLTNSQHIDFQTFATIGVFDGVHVGHRFLLDNLRQKALAAGLKSLVVSFTDSPVCTLAPEKAPKLLTTSDEKLALFEQSQVDFCLMLRFDKMIAELTAADFLRVLHRRFGVRALLVGYDHTFGSDMPKSLEEFRQIGSQIGVQVFDCQQFSVGNRQIASSQVRAALLSGEIASANQLLGYLYRLSGRVVSGNQIGRKIGFPTANLEISDRKLVPSDGVYHVECVLNGEKRVGLLNIGTRPTVHGERRTIEVHFLHFSGDLYNQNLTLQFVSRLRSEQKFANLAELQSQIESDVLRVENSID